jgi:outer membrane protein, heavy metal efflux system
MLKSTRAALCAGALYIAGQPAFAETVTLEQAVAKASEAAPLLRANDAAIAAARAGRAQAGVRPNPSVTVEAENFVGTGPYNVFGQAEITATYSQPIERGGKRDARVALADREIGVAEASAHVTRLELAAAVERAFLDVLISDEVAKIANDRLAIELGMQREALRRVRGYKDPLFVETRAGARVAQARIGVDQARARQVATRNALAAFWGGTGAKLEIRGDLMLAGAVKPALAAADGALAEAQVARASAAVSVEQTRRVQDYTVNGGTRFLRGTNDVALVAGVTIPLGRFDRNQGNIERAQAERLRLELTAEANRLERLRRLASLRADADAARDRANAFVSDVYPRTTRALAQVREGYNRGGFTFRDMQDAADAILVAQDRWLEAVIQYRDLQTEIDRLTGRFDATERTSPQGDTRP